MDRTMDGLVATTMMDEADRGRVREPLVRAGRLSGEP